MRSLIRQPVADLGPRIDALEQALDLADGRLDPEAVGAARTAVSQARERLVLGPGLTVAALAGATGSGKSSLFNALAGREISTASVRRPTTASTTACVWGDEDAGPLLDWLDIAVRHQLDPATGGSDPELDGLVLLDLPDHDSTELAHRLEADRLVQRVDLLVWVLDPQKYADAAIHDHFLRPLAGHSDVMLVVLNQADRLSPQGREACRVDLARLLERDGLRSVPVLLASARTGEGLVDLRDLLIRRVADRRAAVERLAADLTAATASLSSACQPDGRSRRDDDVDRRALVDALAGAAGVENVADAVEKAHRHRAATAVGWPLTRWVRRLRPDPLRRLHLGAGTGAGAGAASPQARSSLPPPDPAQRARVGTALRSAAADASRSLPDPWPSLVRRAATSREDDLPELLERAVAGTRLEDRRPRWWSVVGLFQVLLVITALVGAVWLGVLFVLDYLQLSEVATPEIGGRLPLPTALLLGGLAAGALLGWIGRRLARIGGRRRRWSARRRMLERVGQVADEHVLLPVSEELAVNEDFCTALRRAGGGKLGT